MRLYGCLPSSLVVDLMGVAGFEAGIMAVIQTIQRGCK
jgi:hypothetical protein